MTKLSQVNNNNNILNNNNNSNKLNNFWNTINKSESAHCEEDTFMKTPAHCEEDTFITQSKSIPNSFDSTKHNNILDAKIGLREMKIQSPEILIVGHLNINSIRNKFDE